MAITAVGYGSAMLGAGIVAGKLAGATWKSATVYMVTHIAVSGGVYYLMSQTIPEQILSIYEVHGFVSTFFGSIISRSVTDYFFGENRIRLIQVFAAYTGVTLAFFSLAYLQSKVDFKPSFL